MDNRDCKDCKTNQPIDNFEITNKAKNIRRRVCKKCRVIKRRAYQKKYYKDHYIQKRKPKVETLNAPQVE